MGFLNLKTFEDPNRKPSQGSFATFMIIAPTTFFLGILFSSFPYDYPLLWTSAETPAAFYDQLETHLKFIHASPPIIPRILHIAIAVGLSGFFIKLFKPSEANLLFDGSSLILYVVGIIIYITNIIKGLRLVTAGIWDELAQQPKDSTIEGNSIIGREDSLKVLAASNTILALVLVGVLVLQTGQWYAEAKEKDEIAKFAQEQKEREKPTTPVSQKSGGHATRSSKKKQ